MATIAAMTSTCPMATAPTMATRSRKPIVVPPRSTSRVAAFGGASPFSFTRMPPCSPGSATSGAAQAQHEHGERAAADHAEHREADRQEAPERGDLRAPDARRTRARAPRCRPAAGRAARAAAAGPRSATMAVTMAAGDQARIMLIQSRRFARGHEVSSRARERPRRGEQGDERRTRRGVELEAGRQGALADGLGRDVETGGGLGLAESGLEQIEELPPLVGAPLAQLQQQVEHRPAGSRHRGGGRHRPTIATRGRVARLAASTAWRARIRAEARSARSHVGELGMRSAPIPTPTLHWRRAMRRARRGRA